MQAQLRAMRLVARRLDALKEPFVFLGGSVIGLLVDKPDVCEIRPTKDVDVIVEITTYPALARLEERLRVAGFRHDISEGAPICRWLIEDCRVDMVPTDAAFLNMNSRWLPEAFQCSILTDLGENCKARVVNPALFIATKLEAFKDRGKGDYYASHDLEDIVTIMDGRAAIVEEIGHSPPEVRSFIAQSFMQMLGHPDFQQAMPGMLSSVSGGWRRAPQVLSRFRAAANLG